MAAIRWTVKGVVMAGLAWVLVSCSGPAQPVVLPTAQTSVAAVSPEPTQNIVVLATASPKPSSPTSTNTKTPTPTKTSTLEPTETHTPTPTATATVRVTIRPTRVPATVKPADLPPATPTPVPPIETPQSSCPNPDRPNRYDDDLGGESGKIGAIPEYYEGPLINFYALVTADAVGDTVTFNVPEVGTFTINAGTHVIVFNFDTEITLSPTPGCGILFKRGDKIYMNLIGVPRDVADLVYGMDNAGRQAYIRDHWTELERYAVMRLP
jgi:hypothetical protein